MLTEADLRELLVNPGLTRNERALLCLAVEPLGPRSWSEIRNIGIAAGLDDATLWNNLAKYLRKPPGLAVRTPSGWVLTSRGVQRVAELVARYSSGPVPTVVSNLRTHLSQIGDPDVQAFVEEAIRCLEVGAFRAAVVLSWVGAVALLHRYVVKNKLSDFNAEAQRRSPKWRPAKTPDDLARMKEFDLLQVLESISVIGKNVRQQLEQALQLRNACGHPSSLRISSNIVAAHIEGLLLNVYSRFY